MFKRMLLVVGLALSPVLAVSQTVTEMFPELNGLPGRSIPIGQACGPASEADTHIRTRFREEPVRTEVTEDGQYAFTVYAGVDGQWTLLMRLPSGSIACIVGVGRNYPLEG